MKGNTFMLKLKDVVDGDFRLDGYKEAANYWLLKIPPIAKATNGSGEVSIDLVEKVILSIHRKYKVKMQWVCLTFIEGLEGQTPYYSVSIVDTETNQRVKSLYGITIYELYCKIALFMYAYTRGS